KQIEATWWLGKQLHPISQAHKKVITTRIARVPALAERLAAAGLLNRNEADLLKIEAERLGGEAARLPLFGLGVLCYLPNLRLIGEHTLTRLQTRLELLGALQKSGRMRPTLLAKAIAGLRWDIKILSSKMHLDALDPPQRERGKQCIARAEDMLKAIAPDK
ncbi:MAG: hypothetical protein ACYS5V_11370, partial [Planctomycetota bacterium]